MELEPGERRSHGRRAKGPLRCRARRRWRRGRRARATRCSAWSSSGAGADGTARTADAVHEVEHVLRAGDERCTVAQQAVRAGRCLRGHASGHRCDVATEVRREVRGDQRAGPLCSLDDDRHRSERSHDAVASRKEPPATGACPAASRRRSTRSRESARTAGGSCAGRRRRRRCARTATVRPGAVEASAMSDRVDSEREPADHRHAGRTEPTAQTVGDRPPVLGRPRDPITTATCSSSSATTSMRVEYRTGGGCASSRRPAGNDSEWMHTASTSSFVCAGRASKRAAIRWLRRRHVSQASITPRRAGDRSSGSRAPRRGAPPRSPRTPARSAIVRARRRTRSCPLPERCDKLNASTRPTARHRIRAGRRLLGLDPPDGGHALANAARSSRTAGPRPASTGGGGWPSSHTRSIRSSSGPLSLRPYRIRSTSLHVHCSRGRAHGQPLHAATSIARAGYVIARCPRTTVTDPSSIGWRSASSAARANSGSSSRNSTP